MPKVDVVIIGSGIAAFAVAEKICHEKNVIIITKKMIENNNSYRAQGGIAAAVAVDDHWKEHYEDTLRAGCFHNKKETVRYLVEEGPKEMQRLMQDGMKFDGDANGPYLGKEGAHGKRRILHAGGDATGKNMLHHFIEKIKPYVTIIEHEMVVDLLVENNRCHGVKTRDNNGVITYYHASHTVLATGGIGALYSFSSNADTVTGDGLAMAYRAGADVIDLEFMQFHPTMLYVDGACKGLVSEAVRGEGAILVDEQGEPFMKYLHPQGDLAPRDVVSRAIHSKILRNENIYLDISMIANFAVRFPTITALCEQHGVSIQKGRIPIVPGAHFHMGGIATNLNGETSIHRLYAVGEVACNGVHGANRLASNSLLEGIVFGGRLGYHLLQETYEQQEYSRHLVATKQTLELPTKAEIQELMMHHVGIVRTEEGLQAALDWITQYVAAEDTFVPDMLTNEQITIWNMLTTARLVVQAALVRRESIGGHYRSDFPRRLQQSVAL